MIKIKPKRLIILIVFITVALCIYGAVVDAKIKSSQEKLNTKIEMVSQIRHTKEQLHSAADALRQEYVCDEALAKILSDKWKELDTQEQETNIQISDLKTQIEKLKKTTSVTEASNGGYEVKTTNKGETFLGTFEATAYCITGTTASGTHTTANRTIAVDPKVIPLGSKVRIEGYGTYIAEDTGGVVKGKIVDIYIPGYENCINFGRRKVNVYLIN